MAELGKYAIWRGGLELTPELAAGLERLGYSALWVGGSPDGDLESVQRLLEATDAVTVGTGIVNIWKDSAEVVAESFHRIDGRYPGRFLLGIGVGHPEATTEYTKPYEALVHYLDVLDRAEVPVSRRLLAALGPKVLQLAADRTAGAHPYLTTPEHTASARRILGPDELLVPEQKIVLDADPDRARSVGRPPVASPYLKLSNYRRNLLNFGFDSTDLDNDGSDRLIDALVVHGDASAVAEGLNRHLQAGADQVAIQLLSPAGTDPLPQYTELAEALFG